eukprot:1043463-Amphidinium_carterae.1
MSICSWFPAQLQNFDDLKVLLYVDLDHAGASDRTQSTSGYVTCLSVGGKMCLLDWGSKLQTSTATSSTEAELIAMNRG